MAKSTPHICQCCRSQISTGFALWLLFTRYAPHWDKRTEWPQRNFKPLTGQRYPIYGPSITLESWISIHFTIRPDIFELQAILRQVHGMSPKRHKIRRGHWYPTYVLLLSPSPKLYTKSLYGQPFSSCSPLCDKFTEWPPNWLRH